MGTWNPRGEKRERVAVQKRLLLFESFSQQHQHQQQSLNILKNTSNLVRGNESTVKSFLFRSDVFKFVLIYN